MATCGSEDAAAKVKKAMEVLRAKVRKLGAASIKGDASVAGKKVPDLLLGSTEIDNTSAVVDEVQKETGATVTFFVKSGDDFVRVATNVKTKDSSRAVGTVLDPKGKAIAALRDNKSFYGEVDILGNAYTAGYEPLCGKDKKVIGAMYVGYPK
ncbi:MAG: Cache 3/Cache 2 fusion domain-containing protein [Planctomycetota bacterium]|nr:Cache 3/Cache 2 fusion domain-containing protein [Planctomycetota bacterium]